MGDKSTNHRRKTSLDKTLLKLSISVWPKTLLGKWISKQRIGEIIL